MNILQLTKKFPYPLKDGESIAVTTLSSSLSKLGCKITLLSMNTTKHFVDTSALPESYNHYAEIHTVPLDNRVKPIGAFLNLFSSDSYHVSRFHYRAFEEKLISLLKENEFDIIQLETLYLAPYIEEIRSYTNAKVVLRSHNVEFEIWNRIVESTPTGLKKMYLQYLAKKLKRFEIERLDKYDALVSVTQRDFESYVDYGYNNAGLTSPIGLNIDNYLPAEHKNKNRSLSFIGSLDWMPNLDGLSWFMNDVWPDLLKEFPNLKLYIAGRNTPQEITSLASDSIIVEGEVDSAVDFINSHSLTVVPLLSGSGMRVKIIEGMALGRVVISTSIGAEGIHARHKKEILIADTPEEWIHCIKWINENESKVVEIGINARKFIAENFDQMNNAKSLMEFYNQLGEAD